MKTKYSEIASYIAHAFAPFSHHPWDEIRKKIKKQFGEQPWPQLARFLQKHEYIIFTGEYKPSTIPQSKHRRVKFYMIAPE
jgi:hypothetical protein